MKRASQLFFAGTGLATLVVPGLLLAGAPVDEPRADLGYVAGWGLALLLVVPSYVLMARVTRDVDDRRFFPALLGGTALRFVLGMGAVVLFATLLEQPPIKAFFLAFFVGWLLLTGLEMGVLLRGFPRRRPA